MGQTHPLASDMQTVFYKYITEIIRDHLDPEAGLFKEWGTLVSADDILCCGVGSRINMIKFTESFLAVMELVRGEEAAAHKTSVSRGIRSSFLGQESHNMRFVIDKLSGIGVTTLGSFHRTPGLSASALWGSSVKHALSGVSTVGAFCAFWSVGLEWLKWAFDSTGRDGGIPLETDLPCTIWPHAMPFNDFASGMTLPEADINRGARGDHLHAYLAALDEDFLNPETFGLKDRIPFLTGLKIVTPRIRNAVTEESFQKMEALAEDPIEGGSVSAKAATSLDDPGFRLGIGEIIQHAGGWTRLDQAKELSWIFRNRKKEIVRMGQETVTIAAALQEYRKRAREMNKEELIDLAQKLIDHLYPDNPEKTENIGLLAHSTLEKTDLRLQPVETYPRLIQSDPQTLAFIMKYGTFESARLGVKGRISQLRNDVQVLEALNPKVKTMEFRNIVSLATPHRGPSVAFLSTFRKQGIFHLNPRTAMVFSATDNLIAGFSVKRDKRVLPPTGVHITPGESDYLAKFVLSGLSILKIPLREKLQVLHRVKMEGKPLQQVLTGVGKFTTLLRSMMEEVISEDRWTGKVEVSMGQVPASLVLQKLTKDAVEEIKERTRQWGKERELLGHTEPDRVWIGEQDTLPIGSAMVQWGPKIHINAPTKAEAAEIVWLIFREVQAFQIMVPLVVPQKGWFPETRKQLVWRDKSLNPSLFVIGVKKGSDTVPIMDIRPGRVETPIGKIDLTWDLSSPVITGLDERLEEWNLLSSEKEPKVMEPQVGPLLQEMAELDFNNAAGRPGSPLQRVFTEGVVTPIMLSQTVEDLITVKWIVNQRKETQRKNTLNVVGWKLMELLLCANIPKYRLYMMEKFDDESGLTTIQELWAAALAQIIGFGKGPGQLLSKALNEVGEECKEPDEMDMTTVRFFKRQGRLGVLDIPPEEFPSHKEKKVFAGIYTYTGEFLILAPGIPVDQGVDGPHYLGTSTKDLFFGGGSSEDDESYLL